MHSGLVGTTLYGACVAQFSVCRQPWNDYIKQLTKEDTQPYIAPVYDKPAYRGRKLGREGWLFNQGVELHYHMFPDERVLANLQRWRQGDTVGDLAIQQFRNAQPFNLDDGNESGSQTVDPETYMKLNYKNPATFSRFLSRAGTMFPRDILPLTAEAFKKVRLARHNAILLGFYPHSGNPYWHRSQKFRPSPLKDKYDPLSKKTKDIMEQFAFNWLQADTVKQYFSNRESASQSNSGAVGQSYSMGIQSSGGEGGRRASRAVPLGSGYGVNRLDENRSRQKKRGADAAFHFVGNEYNGTPNIGYSGKNPTVPGLMSTSGMKPKLYKLYASDNKKRMGFVNPFLGIRKK